MGAVHRRGCLTLQAADEPLRWASGRPRGEGRGPVAPPVFKTGLSLLVGDGRFDSFPSPPILITMRYRKLSRGRFKKPEAFGTPGRPTSAIGEPGLDALASNACFAAARLY